MCCREHARECCSARSPPSILACNLIMRDAFGNAFKFSPKTLSLLAISRIPNMILIIIDPESGSIYGTQKHVRIRPLSIETLSLAGFVVVRILSDDTGQKRGSSILLRDDPPVRHSAPSSTHLYLHMVLSRSLLYSNRCARTHYFTRPTARIIMQQLSFHIAGVTCFQEFFRSNRFHTVLSSIVNSLPKKKEEREFPIYFPAAKKGRGNRRGPRASVCVTM